MARRKNRIGAPGIVDVAARAGVSIATVSRAFTSPDKVRGPTRKRIEEAANELGYIRNLAAGSLHNRFSGTIGLVVPTIDNAIFSELIEAFSAQLLSHDRIMLIAAHGYDLKLEVALIRSLLERRIDGLALVGFDHDPVSLNMLAQRNVPVIEVWNHRKGAPLPCVGADNKAAAAAITGHVVAQGHRDIALMFPDVRSNDRARDRLDGVMECLGAAGVEVPAHRRIECPYDVGVARRLVDSMLERSDLPTAVICGNDIIAHGAYFACQARGVAVPGDLSIAGIGDFGSSAHLYPALTTVRMPARQIGTVAADALIDLIETGKPQRTQSQLIDFELKVRQSVARL
jgi:LacI family transcriptional regulator